MNIFKLFSKSIFLRVTEKVTIRKALATKCMCGMYILHAHGNEKCARNKRNVSRGRMTLNGVFETDRKYRNPHLRGAGGGYEDLRVQRRPKFYPDDI